MGNALDVNDLHSAAFNGQLSATRHLISQGAEVNKEHNNGCTALQFAAQNGHLDVTKYLISQGADVNKGDNDGGTALHSAAFNGHLNVTKYLISQGAEVNKGDNDDWTVLHSAAQNGHLDVTKYLISQGADVNKGNNNGGTALHNAALNGHLNVTKYLISQGAEVNKGAHDLTALHNAAQYGHLDVTKYLISQEADVNKGENDGKTALHSAAQDGHLDVTKYLISQGAEVNKGNNDGKTALHSAAQNGHLDVTKYLISQGAEVNERDHGGYTALIHSAVAGRVSVSNYLLKLKSEIDLTHTIYFTELHACSEKGDLDSVKNLVSRGAELDRADTFGWTGFHIAAKNGHLPIVKYLLSQGAKVNSSNALGRTALHNAAKHGHIDVLKCLLKQGADLNRACDVGWSTLRHAIESGKVDMIEYLISQGAEIDSGDVDGMTPLHAASSSGDLDIATCLLRHGADINKRSVSDLNVLHFDSQYGHYDVTKCLRTYFHEVHSLSADKYLVFKPATENDSPGENKSFIQSDAGATETAVGGMITICSPHAICDLDFKDFIVSKARRTVGCTPLDFAVKDGRLELTRYLVSQEADVNDANNVGWTALHFAAQMGHLHIARYLLSKGSEINKANVDDITPLHVAAFMGHSQITDLLLITGADINKATTKKGSTALHVGAQNGHLDVISFLLSNGADVNKADKDSWTALHIAAQNGHLNITKLLLLHHADVKRSTNKGSTALHLSAANGHADITRYLVEHGAETSVSKLDGRTALHLAAEQGHLHVTTYLLTQGIEVNMGDRDGYTPLHLSALKAHVEIAEVLLKEGARVDVRTTNGQTPLHLSSREGVLKISNILAERSKISGTLDQRDGSGFTAIHLATRNGQTGVVKTLVSHGADLNFQSNEGNTCLHEAIKLVERTGRTVESTPTLHQVSSEFDERELPPEKALVLYLLDHGAKLDIRDNEGRLPVHYATSEVVRQMIFLRSSEEMVRSYRAEEPLPVLQTESVHVQHGAEQIELEQFGVSVSIPPGAVQQSDFRRITLTLVRDLPSIDIIDDESMACYGIRCDPPNMIFHQPVKIMIPHSTLVTNPDQVTPDIVSCKWDTNQGLPRTWRKTSSPGDKPPYCRLYKRHLELYIDHCAEWWVLIPLEQQVVRHQLICTPYVPDRIERGEDIDIHLHVHADLPGIETEVHEEEKEQSYHKCHRSVQFRVDSKSGDVTVLFDHDGGIVENKVLSLKNLHGQLRHKVLLSMSPREGGKGFAVINITIAQDGKLGISRSLAFVIKYSAAEKAVSEPPSFFRAVEEVSQSDLHDIDIIKIAEMMTVDHFYDLGVALGFRFQQLDVIEYRRFRDRQQAIYDMLMTWRQRQASGQEAKETFVSLLKSFELQAHEVAISDVGTVGDIPDKTLLAFASRITSEKYFEIGMILGFTKRELQHIEHRTSYNRKDANIQMLSSWKTNQTSGPDAMKALNRVWESLQAASEAENTLEEENLPEREGNSISTRGSAYDQIKPEEPDDMEMINISQCSETVHTIVQDQTVETIDLRGGTPSMQELCSVASPTKSLSAAWELGKALRLRDDVILEFILPSDYVALNRVARQLMITWWKRLGSNEKKDQMTRLLMDYNIQDTDAGRDEIPKKICTTPDLLDLKQRLDLGASDVMQVMCSSSIIPSTPVSQSALQMLKEWERRGGTRQRLLEVAQAFHFNNAADKVATGMQNHPGFVDLFSKGIIDHKGGQLELDELGLKISVPEGAIPKGMRSVITLRVPCCDSARIPLQEGEVLITPVVECSFTQELLKPATVSLPHCFNADHYEDDCSVILYTKTGPGCFGRKNLLPQSTRDYHMSKNRVDFSTRHIHLWALASTNVQGVQFTCETFQNVFMPLSQQPTLRVCLFHPCDRYASETSRVQKSSLDAFCPVTKPVQFSLESKDDDFKISCLDDSEIAHKMVPVRGLLNGECITLNFELQFSSNEGGKKSLSLHVQQGSTRLVEQEFSTSIEAEPDYGASQVRGRLRFASDSVLKGLTNIVLETRDVRLFGYQLGFSYSEVEKYLNRADSSTSIVSRIGFGDMLRAWRRRVRPREQVERLRRALEEIGLGNAADVLLHESCGMSTT